MWAATSREFSKLFPVFSPGNPTIMSVPIDASGNTLRMVSVHSRKLLGTVSSSHSFEDIPVPAFGALRGKLGTYDFGVRDKNGSVPPLCPLGQGS